MFVLHSSIGGLTTYDLPTSLRRAFEGDLDRHEQLEAIVSELRRRDPARRAALLARLARAHERFEAWDALERAGIRSAALSCFRAGPELPFSTQIRTPRELRDAARCVGVDWRELLPDAARGTRLFYVVISRDYREEVPVEEPLLVTIAAVDSDFVVFGLRAPNDRNLTLIEYATILKPIVSRLAPGPRRCPPMRESMKHTAAVGRRAADRAERRELVNVLADMAERDADRNPDRFCILDCGSWFVQFHSLPTPGSFVCEILSHRYDPGIGEWLNGTAREWLSDWDFDWPLTRANFSTIVRLQDRADAARLADFVLGVRRTLWGDEGRLFRVTTSVGERLPAYYDTL